MKLGRERNWVTGNRDAKVGCARLTVYYYVSQRSVISPDGGKNPSDTFDRAEVGIAERVIASNRRATRIVCLPRPKETG